MYGDALYEQATRPQQKHEISLEFLAIAYAKFSSTHNTAGVDKILSALQRNSDSYYDNNNVNKAQKLVSACFHTLTTSSNHDNFKLWGEWGRVLMKRAVTESDLTLYEEAGMQLQQQQKQQ